jgi:hypothetical protein
VTRQSDGRWKAILPFFPIEIPNPKSFNRGVLYSEYLTVSSSGARSDAPGRRSIECAERLHDAKICVSMRLLQKRA